MKYINKIKLILSFTLLVLFSLLIAGCNDKALAGEAVEGDILDEVEDETLGWREVTIKDVNSGEKFAIKDFQGKKVLIHVFAVWCPTCWLQGEQLKELRGSEMAGDDLVFISLDTDPNEDEAILTEYTGRLGFDWRFVNSPAHLTQSLIDEFGVAVVNPPWDPIVLVCEDQSARLLGKGVKSAEEIYEEIEEGC